MIARAAAVAAALGMATACGAPPAPPPGPAPTSDARVTTPIEREYEALARTNPCPDGYPALQGRWRFAGETRTPDFAGRLDVTGTRFEERLSGRPEGVALEATVRGQVRCLFRNRVLFIVEDVQPDGAFGNHAGDQWPCDVLTGMASSPATADRVMTSCYFDWDLRTSAGREYEYERIEGE